MCSAISTINHIIPVATRYLSLLLDNMVKIRTLFPGNKGEELSSQDAVTVEKIMRHCSVIKEEVAKMVNARKEANKIDTEREKALAYSHDVAPCLEVIRYHIDKLRASRRQRNLAVAEVSRTSLYPLIFIMKKQNPLCGHCRQCGDGARRAVLCLIRS